jgi:large subunit ribosomal protein L18
MAKKTKREGRLRRQLSVRKKVLGSAVRPRLSVFRSNNHIYAQLIDDVAGVTLGTATSLKSEGGNKTENADQVGKAVAEVAKAKGIDSVVFDRNGFLYHGRVKAVAEGARSAGLKF